MRSDDPRATLAGIRERSAAALEFPMSGFAEDSIRCCTQSAMDVPLLVGALDAVLKLADEAIPALGLTPADCTDACDSGACDCSGTARVVAWNLDPAKVREAITAALAGKEAGGISHDERCCMTGNLPGTGPHPDCPGYPYWPDEVAGDGG